MLQAKSNTAKLDVEILLTEVLGKDRAFLYMWPDKRLTHDQLAQFSEFFMRRQAGEPIAYIIGKRTFWDLELDVDTSTLIPRPDTELLIEHVLQLVQEFDSENFKLLDLGTGTGAIALALAKELSDWDIDGVDISADCVLLARRNCAKYRLDNVSFFQSNWFAKLSSQYQIIVSNPPYIDSHDPHLNDGDVAFEPRSALVAQDAGIADLRHIIETAPDYLCHNGWVVLEHGWQQAEKVRQLLRNKGYCQVASAKDLNNIERISFGCFAGE